MTKIASDGTFDVEKYCVATKQGPRKKRVVKDRKYWKNAPVYEQLVKEFYDMQEHYKKIDRRLYVAVRRGNDPARQEELRKQSAGAIRCMASFASVLIPQLDNERKQLRKKIEKLQRRKP